MKAPPNLFNETQRQLAIDAYGLANDVGELGLDGIVRLASHFFDVPIALVTLVERDRQLFLAREGVEICETPREISFCGHALSLGVEDLLVVPDATLDPRFSDNPLVLREPFIRFYAGCPLRTPDGHILGTLCLADPRPRTGLSTAERESLFELAALVMDKLDSRRLVLAQKASQTRFQHITATSPDGIVCADDNGRITFWNGACERLFGYDAKTAIGNTLDIIVPPVMRGGHMGGLARVAGGGTPKLVGRTVELEAVHVSGRHFPIELSLSMWRESGHACFGAIIRDISARRADETRLYELAHVDALSRLPNRLVLLERIDELVREAQPFAVLMLDLDGFKDVNDTRGHNAGDDVLREVARRLLECVRPTDTVARLGGDEFSVLLPGCDNRALVERIGDCILGALTFPFQLEGGNAHVSASIGAAFSPLHGNRVADLLSASDLAMYQAKADGRNCLRFFNPDLRRAVMNRHAIEADIRRAVETGEFELFYQPQVCATDGRLLGVEALLRWRHPGEGLLAPYRFLPTVESGQFAAVIGRWVMETACEHAVKLRRHMPGIIMGVNLFGAQFRTGLLALEVTGILERTGLPAHALELEITENIILKHDDMMLAPLRSLHAMGVGIAFDDFGTGYASLSLLKRYPLTRLKIDRSFIQDVCTDAADASIVNAVILMARNLGFKVIAEGVETAEQRDFLVAHGCSAVQGYFYGKPMSASDLWSYLEEQHGCRDTRAAEPPAAQVEQQPVPLLS
jgi:diguanylate cyclase (GGDEF)-like protein/PAS domain S-box-containing protein